MTARPKPPAFYEENPELGPDFFTRAKPAAPGEAARLHAALAAIVEAHDAGKGVSDKIESARALLGADPA